ncbi:MAG: hypothetical protein AAF532_17260 [Planctomycetota bacterium]
MPATLTRRLRNAAGGTLDLAPDEAAVEEFVALAEDGRELFVAVRDPETGAVTGTFALNQPATLIADAVDLAELLSEFGIEDPGDPPEPEPVAVEPVPEPAPAAESVADRLAAVRNRAA